MATTYTPSHPTKKYPPRLSHGLPYLGHALEFARDPVGLLHKGRQQFGDIFSFYLIGKQVTVLTGPNANQAFFKAPDHQLSAREAYKFTIPIFGKGIAYDASPEIMSEQIGFVFPALREERMRTYAQFMAQEAQAYFDSWGSSGEIDLLSACNELTIFIAGRCLIGEEFRTHLTTEFAHLYHDIEGALHLLGFFWPYLPLPSFKRRDKARIRMVELIAEIVANRRNQGIETEDFLQTLIAAQYSDGTALSEDNITGLLLTLLFAGQHTSAVLAAWTGILLLQHPQYLPTILQEQKQVFGENPEMSLTALGRLSDLESAIREAERMRPPLVMLMRQILEDFEYEEYTMPAGGLVMVSSAVSHRIAEVFPNPDRYDPSRFAPGREEHRQHRYALIGFGGGRHRCIGEAFAYQQVKVIWSILLQQFDLELVQGSYEPNYTTWVVGPRQPCLVRYQRK
ncbi:MAG: cytochrome P450 [Moorea sp. SIOASIH]|uniref:cytochrome P450 n=1 Tax=Moorena sp. SIOASIH TaxID=2607817 RepID=UPI0013BD447F|nr:cytochrome P450 [Moorena sp. SIOASIH]NEO42096.1 cytochrome P450 [Moorena sp. SIOASIH]